MAGWMGFLKYVKGVVNVSKLGIYGTSTVTAAPTISSGTGAPTASEPKGSLYLRKDGTAGTIAYVATDAVGTWSPLEAIVTALADPGTGAAIPVTKSAHVALTIGSAGAETNTLAIPTFIGQRMIIALDVVGTGTRVVTVTGNVNQTGNNTLTFGTARDACVLEATQVAGALVWVITANDGVGLTTV